MTQVLSIDIGVRNLALWIEEYNSDKIQECKQKFKIIKQRTNDNNEPTEEYKTYLQEFMTSASKTIYADKIDLAENIEFKKTKNNMIILDNRILFNVVKEFDKRRELLLNVNCIIIEKQLKNNPNAQTIQNHIHAYFLHQYGLSKNVEIFDSCHKTRLLGCPRKISVDGKMQKINKAYRKRWTTKMTQNTLLERKDKKFYRFVFEENKSKADDLSDTFCQATAFMLYNFL
jgi:hypothetical protein